MSTDRETTRLVRSWLEDGVTALPDRVLDAVLDQLPATPQRRSRWSAWRSMSMNNYAKLAAAAATVLVIAVVGYQLLPGKSGPGTHPSAVPTAQSSPSTLPSQVPTLPPDTQTIVPFADESITITFAMPEGWERFEEIGTWIAVNAPPGGAAVFFYRGSSLYGEPCRPSGVEERPDILVGPTVDDFVTALVEHPSLDVTAPVDVSLAGYSGKYLDLQVPADISECDTYLPIDGHIYAQGPSHQWHMWVLDVDGVRVVVETNDYPGTSAERLAELQAILDSLVITS